MNNIKDNINDRTVDGRHWHVFMRYPAYEAAQQGARRLSATGRPDVAVLHNPDLAAGGTAYAWEVGQFSALRPDHKDGCKT